MKKFALALMAMSALVFGFGVVAEAQAGPYGGGSGSMSFSKTNPAPGEPITITVTGCQAGEILTFAVDGTVIGTVTATGPATLGGSVTGLLLPRQAGTASATFNTVAPSQPGTYTYTCTGDQGCRLSATLVVSAAGVTPIGPSGALPATGSGGLSTTTTIAIGLLAVGLGLLVVAQVRRRSNPSPA